MFLSQISFGCMLVGGFSTPSHSTVEHKVVRGNLK